MNNLVIELKLSVEEVNVVMAGLGKLPLETSVSVWKNIQDQAQPQVNAASNAPAPVLDASEEASVQ
jgi:hypothetical protein